MKLRNKCSININTIYWHLRSL